MERKEPTLGTSSNTPDDSRRPANTPRPTATRPAARPPASGTPRPVARSPEPKQSQGLAVFALLLALAGVAGSGYLAWQLQVEQQNTSAMRDKLEGRIAELEGKLNMTEGEAMESAEAFKAKLVWADSEIRKLWGVAYDTNRKGIAENKDDIAELAKKLDGSSKKLVAELKAQMGQVDGKLLAAQATVDEQYSRIQKELEKLAQLEKQFGQLRNDLTNRIKVNEEAVQAIDVYRRTINRDLLNLQERVNGIQSK